MNLFSTTSLFHIALALLFASADNTSDPFLEKSTDVITETFKLGGFNEVRKALSGDEKTAAKVFHVIQGSSKSVSEIGGIANKIYKISKDGTRIAGNTAFKALGVGATAVSFVIPSIDLLAKSLDREELVDNFLKTYKISQLNGTSDKIKMEREFIAHELLNIGAVKVGGSLISSTVGLIPGFGIPLSFIFDNAFTSMEEAALYWLAGDVRCRKRGLRYSGDYNGKSFCKGPGLFSASAPASVDDLKNAFKEAGKCKGGPCEKQIIMEAKSKDCTKRNCANLTYYIVEHFSKDQIAGVIEMFNEVDKTPSDKDEYTIKDVSEIFSKQEFKTGSKKDEYNQYLKDSVKGRPKLERELKELIEDLAKDD